MRIRCRLCLRGWTHSEVLICQTLVHGDEARYSIVLESSPLHHIFFQDVFTGIGGERTFLNYVNLEQLLSASGSLWVNLALRSLLICRNFSFTSCVHFVKDRPICPVCLSSMRRIDTNEWCHPQPDHIWHPWIWQRLWSELKKEEKTVRCCQDAFLNRLLESTL